MPGLRRLLILDDEPMTGATLQRMVALNGFEARHVTHVDEFFRLMKEWAPDVVSLDLIMPGMDGIEVIRSLGARHLRSQIIITSGVDQRVLDAAERSARAHGLNIVGSLAKPFSARDLRQLLHKATQCLDTQGSAPVDLRGQASHALSAGDLRRALLRHEIKLAYQPKVHCSTGVLIGFEALARWPHPELGHVSPELFVTLAERHGLIDELSCYITDQALTWLAQLPLGTDSGSLERQYLELAQLSLNVSALSLSNEALFDSIALRCRQLGIAPQRIILELTETSAMQDPTTALDNLTRLRLQGFHLSIDDFGTGYSSMVQLVKLPFSEIKIDKSFVMTAAVSEESRAIMRSVVDLGRSLGLTSTAEGVEDEFALNYLRELGCDNVQGYFVSRPLAPDAVLPWFLRREARRHKG